MTDAAHCRNHPGATPISTCSQCGAPLCWQCTRPSPRGFLCPACVETGAQPAVTAAAVEPPPAAEAAAPAAQAAAPEAPAAQPPPVPPVGGLHHRLHSPTIAVLLSFMPGLGMMYNRQLIKGALVMLGFLAIAAGDLFGDLGHFIIPVVYFWQIFDAYFTAKDIRDGQQVEDMTILSPGELSRRIRGDEIDLRVQQELHRVGTQVHEQVGLAAAQVSQSFSKEWSKMSTENAAYAARVRAQALAVRHSRPAAPGWGIFMILLGVLLTMSNYDVRWTRSDLLWPIIMLGLGVIFLSVFFWPGRGNGGARLTDPAAKTGDSDATA